MENLIDINRAVSENRKITFSRAKGWYLYYETIFGEEFPIPFWKIPSLGINKTALAIDFKSSMENYNNSLKR